MDDKDVPPSHPSHPDYRGREPLPGEGAKPADAPDPMDDWQLVPKVFTKEMIEAYEQHAGTALMSGALKRALAAAPSPPAQSSGWQGVLQGPALADPFDDDA